jgi:RimJ/RimL family protein N-acetyltransferase
MKGVFAVQTGVGRARDRDGHATLFSFPEFTASLMARLGAGETPDTTELLEGVRLTEDLHFDSISWLILWEYLEGGASLPEEYLLSFHTLGDIYHAIRLRWEQGALVGSRPGTPPPTNRVRLRQLEPGDYDFVYRLATDPVVGPRWRCRGTTPSPDELIANLWQDLLAQAVVVTTEDRARRIALVQAYKPSNQGTAFLSVLAEPETIGTGRTLEGITLFVDRQFATFNLRYLYAEMLDPVYRSVASGVGSLFQHYGALPEHEFIDGRYQTLHLIGTSRQQWKRGDRGQEPGTRSPAALGSPGSD